MKPKSVLSYGTYGSGKTAFGVSSFWDIHKREPVPGQTGRWLLIGRESNDALGVPEEMIRRFPVPHENPTAFMQDFTQYIKTLVAAAYKTRSSKGSSGIGNIVVDGFTEMNHCFTWAYEEQKTPGDKWEVYREFKKEFMSTIQKLSPTVLDANIFATARIAEVKKATRSRDGKATKGDPEWMDFNFYPAIEGWAKYNMGHYFDFVVYHEQEFKDVAEGGKKVKQPVFTSHWMPDGDFVVKNIYSHAWKDIGMEHSMANMTWPQVAAALDTLA